MKDKVLVKDLKQFVDTQEVLFASGNMNFQRTTKRLWVSLHAGPNVQRYTVRWKNNERGFTNRGEAVRFYNDL